METRRILPKVAAPDAYDAVLGLEAYIRRSGLPRTLVELIKMRASQINGCAYCLDTHSKDARRLGETEQRLYLLNAWQEARCYAPAERAALAWTDSLTRVAGGHPPPQDLERLGEHFSDKEIVDLTILIGLINLWNRLAIGMHYDVPADLPPQAA